MAEQLIKKDCKTGEYANISPVTTTDSVKDPVTGKTLDKIIEESNHLYLPFIENSKTKTRLQVPQNLRRKGLWVTYTSCKNQVTTEWYNGESFDDTAWGDSANWTSYIAKDYIKEIVDDILGWYKI